MSRFINYSSLPGQKYGRIVIVSVIREAKNGIKSLVLGVCDCGCTKEFKLEGLRSGHTTSCGCARKEHFTYTIHNLSKSKEYGVWEKMVARCECPRQKGYNNYGGRGIVVCEEWRKFPETFINWYLKEKEILIQKLGDLPKYIEIDRIDNDGNYCPENCRILSRKENNFNKRTNYYITHEGKKISAIKFYTENQQKANVSYHTFYYRIKHGWNIEEALLVKGYCK